MRKGRKERLECLVVFACIRFASLRKPSFPDFSKQKSPLEVFSGDLL